MYKKVENRIPLILSALLVCTFLFNVQGIRWGLPSKTLTLATYHPDEAFVFQSLENIYKTRSLHPKKIALHYGTFHFYLSGLLLLIANFMGFFTMGSREFLLFNLDQADRMYLVVRFFSAGLGVLSVWATYKLGKRVFDWKVGLLAAALLAFSPVQIAISHYAKLDAMLPPLTILLCWFCLNLGENPSKRNAWICGILAGLLAATRYNSGVLILLPLWVAWRRKQEADWRNQYFRIIFGSLLAFLAATPYALKDSKTFFAGLEHMWSFISSSGLPTVSGSKASNIFYLFTSMIPYAIGWPAALLFIFGIILAVKRRLRFEEKLMILGMVAVALPIMLTPARYTYYVAPILPLILLFSGFAAMAVAEVVETIREDKLPWVAALVLFQAAIGQAFCFLYTEKNTREAAAEWLLQNVGPKDTVGMIRSYFWTPGLLRQQNPPITVVKAGDDNSEMAEAISNLGSLQPRPKYFLLSELEELTAQNLTESGGNQNNQIKEFLADYEEAARFELEPTILDMRLWKRPAPWDFKEIAPRLSVYVRI